MKLRTACCALMFMISAGAIAPAAVADAEAFVAAFNKANETRKQARALGHEWRYTAKMLKDARAAAEEGDFETAMELVATAQLQAEQAVMQAVREAGLWESRVLR